MNSQIGKKPTVGILTTFYNFDSSYSLCSVVESQLASLVKHGYKTVLFVHDNFKDDDKVPEGVEVRKVVPRFKLVDYADHRETEEGFDEQVRTVYAALKPELRDIDVIFEHDLIFQGWFLPYCVAIHQLARELPARWFHWVHSVPNLMPKGLDYPHTLRYQLPDKSKLVYLNNIHLVRAAESYGVFPKDVRIVYNPVDPRLFKKSHPLVKKLLDSYPILEADYVQVYPLSTPRMVSGKQVNVVIEVFSKLKEQGSKVALIICNAHANAEKEKHLIEETLSYAGEKGLTRNEVIFTSLEGQEYEKGVPKEVVSELFSLSNLFVFPSISENCSLILLEAMLSKCLLVLNESVPPLREFGRENALYFEFGGLGKDVQYDSRDGFFSDVAKIINSEMSRNKPLRAQTDLRQHYNYDAIFKKQIEPLLYE